MCLLILLFAPRTVSAQFLFNNIQPKNGFSSKAITSIYKDREGFVWVGTTDGLNRYNGSSVKFYIGNKGSSKKLPDSYITSITGTGKESIWLGTLKGLAHFNKVTDSFKTISFIDTNNKLQSSPAIGKLLIAGNRLWIFTGKGMYTIQNDQAVPVSKLYKGAVLLNASFCIPASCIVDEQRKGMWIGTFQGLFFFNYQTGEVFSKNHNPEQSKIFTGDTVIALARDEVNNLWVASKRHPLASFSFRDNRFSDIPFYDETRQLKIKVPPGIIFYDSHKRLWIASEFTKIVVMQPGKKTSILPDQSPPGYKPGHGAFNNIYEDDERNLWVATPNGLFKLSATNPLLNIVTFPGRLPKPFVEDVDINAVKPATDGEWWMCKDDGLFLFREADATIERFVFPTDVIAHNRFFDVEFIDGKWWCCTRDGIQILDPVTKKFTPFSFYAKGHEVRGRSVYWLHKDKNGFIWFAAWADAIYRFDPKTKQTTRFDGLDKSYGDIGLTNSLCVLEAADGRIWMSYGGNGLRVFDYATNKFHNPVNQQSTDIKFDSLVISSIVEDKDHNMLISTLSDGILKISPNGNCSNFLTVENGLPSNKTNCIFLDKNNVAWTVVNGNVYYKNAGAKIVSAIKIKMDIPVQDAWSSIQSAGNKLYISLVNKLVTIDLSKISNSPTEYPTLISAISVFEKEIPFSSLRPAVHLKYDENFFTIEFSSPVDNEHSSVQYAYQLVGFDKDWVYGGSRQIASYTNVPGGNYRFLVKSTKENGEWSNAVNEIKIMVQAPFYKRWWFVLLMLTLLVLLAFRLRRLALKIRQKRSIDSTIDYFANSVYGQNSVTEICWDIARNCISQLKLEDCVVYLLDKERKVLVQKAAFGPKNPKGHEIANPLEIEIGKGIVGTVGLTCKPLLIKNTSKDNRYIRDDEQRMSELAVPILHEGKLIGVIDSEHSEANFFTADHQKALSTIASISSNKIAEARAEAASRQNEVQLLEINKLLAESQLMALRTQMNPHFVFNCLNSIQECIVTEKYPEAITYLNKFSKLFRSILNNSGKMLVTLHDEIEVLELYLVLEHMRFEKSFTYQVIVDVRLDEDEIELPSMLLQPYVENALWHGLMHKKDDKQLTIEFKYIDEETFSCIIDDNGIGRKQSYELKKQQSTTRDHKSKGMAITKDRIDLLKRQGNHASLTIIDKEENGQATGTKVIIELSAFLK